jgi:hypothetical protein
MAPEIALKEPYGKEADVFSLSMLLWEIVSLEILYPDYSLKDYYFKVCKSNERPPITGEWPAILKALVQEGWDRSPEKRPPMKRIATLVRALLQDLSSGDESIMNRTRHMLDKSRRSLHNTNGVHLSASGNHVVESDGSEGPAARRRAGKKSSSHSTTATTTNIHHNNNGNKKTNGVATGSTRRLCNESYHEYIPEDV